MLRRFFSDRRGLSAVEFALISPLLVLFYFATVEIDSMLTVDRRVTSVANTIADLVAQDDQIDQGELNDIFTVAQAIMAPYDRADNITVVVTSVRLDDQDRPVVVWSRAHNGAGRAAGSRASSAPQNLFAPGGSLIMAEASYEYDAPIAHFLDRTMTMRETFYLRPRRSNSVCFVTNNGSVC